MDVQPVDLGDEVRQRVQPRLDLAPVVLRRPVAGELLIVASCTPWDVVRDRFLLGPSGCVDAPAQFGRVPLPENSPETDESQSYQLPAFVRLFLYARCGHGWCALSCSFGEFGVLLCLTSISVLARAGV